MILLEAIKAGTCFNLRRVVLGVRAVRRYLDEANHPQARRMAMPLGTINPARNWPFSNGPYFPIKISKISGPNFGVSTCIEIAQA